ncbi:Ankyrin repeat-containing protein 3 [Elsinoe fawcettii]|nr:Ankyrin repeat-containing protein 3 [Elsinoe fawcettii]
MSLDDLLNLPTSPASAFGSVGQSLQGSPKEVTAHKDDSGSGGRHERARKRRVADAEEEEDWTQVEDMAERRRIQNRNAQRAYRKKRKQPKDPQTAATVSNERLPQTAPTLEGCNDLLGNRRLVDRRENSPGQTQRVENHADRPNDSGTREEPQSHMVNRPGSLLRSSGIDSHVEEDIIHNFDFLDPNELMFPDLDLEQSFSPAQEQSGPPVLLGSTASATSPKGMKVVPVKARSALQLALQNGHLDAAKVLIKSNLALVTSSLGSRPVLQQLVDAGQRDFVQELSRVRDRDGNTTIHLLAANGDMEALQIILQGGPDLEATNRDGKTALHLAASNGHADVVRLLAAQGADIKAIVRQRNDSIA